MTNTARRWLLAGAFTAAGIAGAAAYDAATHAAQADTKPGIVAEQGGLPCHDLPRQASDRAKAVVAEVTPDKPQQDEPAEEPAPPPPAPAEPEPEPASEPEPAPPAEPEPTEEPAPVDEPTTDPRTTEPAPTPTEPAVDVPPADEPTPAAPTPTPDPVVVTVPDPAAVTLPADDPAPLPDAEAPAPTRRVVLPALPALPAASAQLPVAIGPVPAAEPAVATVGEMPGAAAVLEDAPECDQERAIRLDRNLIRQLIDSLTEPDTEPVKAKPGCPSDPKPTPDANGCTGTATTTNSPSGGTHLHADTGTTLTLPTLDRLEHARARSAIPTSRHVAIEPGPA